MADTNKDNKNNQDGSGNAGEGIKIAFKPSNDKVDAFATKKTAEQIKTENEQTLDLDTSLDINKNLGSFGNIAEPSVTVDTNVAVLEKIEAKNAENRKNIVSKGDKNSEINFAKFDKTRSPKVKTKIGIKLDIWLRQPRTLLRVWLVALAIIIVLWTSQILYLVYTNHILSHPSNYAPSNLYHPIAIAGNVFCYISIMLPVPAFLFLLTAAIIGINGILSSRTFHMFLWSLLIAAIVCFIISSGCNGFFMQQCYSFTNQPNK